jgi:hypothetical protein
VANIIINGTTYDGTPTAPTHPYKPNKIRTQVRRIGRRLEGKDGTETWMHRNIKRTFTIDWQEANETTRAALRAVRSLTTSFSFTDHLGTAYTVLCSGEDDYVEETAFTDHASAIYYNISLVLRQV